MAFVSVLLLSRREITHPPAAPFAAIGGQAEKEETGSSTDIGVEKLRPSSAAGTSGVESWWEYNGLVFMVRPVNQKAYSHGLVSVAPVPQRRMFPVDGLL